MRFLKNIIGRKIVIAVTGQLMVIFAIFHLLGNYFNPYPLKLPDIGYLIWIIRLALFLSFCLHTFFGIQVELENRRAKPESYAVKKSLRTTFAAKTMLWSGVLSGVFILFHLLNFAFSVFEDSFRNNYIIAFVYITGLTSVFLHLYHGIASFFQTMGWNNCRSLPVITKTGKGLALLLSGGFICIILLSRI